MEDKKSTKEKILSISLKLFSENTYHGTSIRDIAKHIGKRESSIYNHFKAKEEILVHLIDQFSSRNFGPIILTDDLINNISKPEKFFILLSENLISFWNSENERMFIKILLSKNAVSVSGYNYTINDYLDDFKSLCSFIFKEMMNHKFISKFDVKVLGDEFVSPLFLYGMQNLYGNTPKREVRQFIKNHVDFFWRSVKK